MEKKANNQETKQNGLSQNCALVRDLLPNYVEKLTSEESNQFIANHLNECKECTSLKEAMTREVTIEKLPKDRDMKRIWQKTKVMLLLKGIGISMGLIAILVCFIVDVAVNRALTWSLIVDGGIVYAAAIITTFVKMERNRFYKSLAVATVLVLPLLYLIQNVVNTNYFNPPIYWFRECALPISVLWIVVIWIIVLLQAMLHLNLWNLIGCVMIAALIGSPVTTMIATKLPFAEIYMNHLEFIDAACYIAGAIVTFYIGHKRKGKNLI